MGVGLKSECLDRKIFFSEESLRVAITEFLAHCHAERNHQGLRNRLIEPADPSGCGADHIRCCQRLGVMLRYYYRQTA